MKRTLPRVWTIIFLCFLVSQNAIAQDKTKWRIKNRLQGSYEFDDNIFESTSESRNNIEDSSLRFLFHSRAFRNSPKLRLSFSYRSGLQTYFQNEIENKLINDFDFGTAFRLNRFAFGVRGSGRLKIYLNHDLDYVTGDGEVFLRFPQILKLSNEIALRAAGLNYQNFTVFDYSENELIWRISRRLSSRVNLSIEFAGKRVRYDTTEVDIPEGTAETFRKIKRTDDTYKAKFQVSYSKSYLINFSYTFQHNDSNNPALIYSKHQFTLIFGLPLSSTVWLRGYGAAQLKDYTQETVPSFPTDVDTEREQSNFFILDISKDLNPNLTALLRLAYYNNESIIRSRFYRKTLVTLGVDFRF